MAAGIAHDFNNALFPVLGFTDLALKHPEHLQDEARIRQYLQKINRAANDAAAVVKRLRQFYKKDQGDEDIKPVDINDLVTESVSITQPRWKDESMARGLDLRIETRLGEVPVFPVNGPEIREVLTNLIFNAVDAMPEGGVITIRTRAEGAEVILEVIDTGTGMTEDTRRRCLEPFFTTKDEDGTGLGLSVTHGILQRHGGSMDVESEVGKGTTFILRLPVKREERVPSKSN
jgi:signal transduction histidine kinase